MIDKISPSVAAAVADIPDGATILIGGFGTAGMPAALIDALIAQGARDLVIVNKFGKQECFGRGFRDVIAQALAQGVPVLLSVPAEQLPGFHAFAGEMAQPVAPGAALDWCRARVALA